MSLVYWPVGVGLPMPKPDDGAWVWCSECAGVGEVEREGHEGMHEEITCPECGGCGGWYEDLNDTPADSGGTDNPSRTAGGRWSGVCPPSARDSAGSKTP